MVRVHLSPPTKQQTRFTSYGVLFRDKWQTSTATMSNAFEIFAENLLTFQSMVRVHLAASCCTHSLGLRLEEPAKNSVEYGELKIDNCIEC